MTRDPSDMEGCV